MQNKHLIGFNNGTYDLSTNIFTNTKYDTLPRFIFEYDYLEYKDDDSTLIEINDFLIEVLQDSETKQFVLDYIASIFDTRKYETIFNVWCGDAKSQNIMKKLIEQTFGKCVSYINSIVMPQKKSVYSNSQFKNITMNNSLIIVDSTDTKINLSIYKEFTEFNNIFMCKDIPEINRNDGGTWKRLRVTHWNPISKEYKNVHDWTQPFIWLLLNRVYPLYLKNGLRPSNEMMNLLTNKYKASNNFYKEFIEYIKGVEGISNINSMNDPEMYQCFKDWYKESYSTNPPIKKEALMGLKEVIASDKNK